MKWLKFLAILLLGICGFAAPAFAAAPAEEPVLSVSPVELRADARRNRAFGVRLYKQLAQHPGNVFISPISLAGAFGPVAAGAGGRTYMEIGRLMGFRADPKLLPSHVGELLRTVEIDGNGGEASVSIANGLWLTKRFPVKPAFVPMAKGSFDAEVESLDFSNSPEAAARINSWVHRETKGRIPKLFEPDAFDKLTALVVTNAVHFVGDWDQPFNAHFTRKQPFYLEGGGTREVPLMAAEQVHRYAEVDGVQLLESRYKGDRFNMVIILPKERDGLAAVEKRLSDAKLGEWLEKLDAAEPQDIGVLLPKVQVESSYALVDPLKSMGMTTAFDMHRAEFSGISERRIYISDVVQKTFLRIDEKGTEAAAATGVVMRGERGGPSLEFRADHPFLALIRDKETGAVLFLGRIAEP